MTGVNLLTGEELDALSAKAPGDLEDVEDGRELVPLIHRMVDEIRVMRAERGDLLRLIRDLLDSDACWFDHHGGCQAHGYLSLEPGEQCPHAEAKAILAAEQEAVR
jgi:hypothetical protein